MFRVKESKGLLVMLTFTECYMSIVGNSYRSKFPGVYVSNLEARSKVYRPPRENYLPEHGRVDLHILTHLILGTNPGVRSYFDRCHINKSLGHTVNRRLIQTFNIGVSLQSLDHHRCFWKSPGAS